MQIVAQTKKRTGWSVSRTLAALGVPRSVYYAWKGREILEDQVGKPCRVYEVLRSTHSSGEYNFRPTAPNQQWHTDVMYVWVAARFYSY